MAETNEARGPDFSKGVPLGQVPPEGALAGHVAGQPVLVSRLGGALFAVGGQCTHYGAPLGEGLVVGETVRCPWHHACFSLRTGVALKAPAFAALDRWAVEVVGDTLFVRAKLDEGRDVETRPASSRDRPSTNRIVILGGGAAGFAAAEMLRRLGHAGALTMLSGDAHAPYDRPNLSKDYLAGTAPEEWIPLQGPDFYRDRQIDLRLSTRATAIDVQRRTLLTEGGETIGFDSLLIATGAEPVRLPVPGFDLPNVHRLRTLDDARAIIAATDGAAAAAVIGASFIGLEAAASLRTRGLEVHVIAPEPVPMEKVLGAEMGAFVRGLHEARGVIFHLGRTAAGFDGRTLRLDDGSAVAADLVVVGTGVKPRIELAASAGIAVGDGILVDAYLETDVPGIYAAGDVAAYPLGQRGPRARIEHWVAAQRQGQAAARNMLGARAPFADVPFFWSRHYDTSILYVGHARSWDEVRTDGNVAAGDAIVRFLEDGVLRASASIGRPLESLREELRLEQAELATAMPAPVAAPGPTHDGA